jgi:hypothetical protein
MNCRAFSQLKRSPMRSRLISVWILNAIGEYPYNRVASSTHSCEQPPLRPAFHAVRDKNGADLVKQSTFAHKTFLDQHSTRVLCIRRQGRCSSLRGWRLPADQALFSPRAHPRFFPGRKTSSSLSAEKDRPPERASVAARKDRCYHCCPEPINNIILTACDLLAAGEWSPSE